MIQTLESNVLLDCSFDLPCGATIKNRLIKSAMSDGLADGEGNPTECQIRLYQRWAEGGVGLSIVGEVQVDPNYPESPGNIVLGDHSNYESLQALTSRASINGAHIWAQLGHAGALAYQPISQLKGPSTLKIGEFECLGMSEEEVSCLPDQYASAAKIAKKAGFTGVQIHAGHGFLLSQFLSPLFNRRADKYGGSVEARSKIVVEIISKVRAMVGGAFPISIKMNSSDQLEGGLTQEEALGVVQVLNHTTVDLIEISGGSYFPGAKASSDRASSGAYYIDFAMRARSITNKPLALTGGFKECTQALNVMSSKMVDFIGLARVLILKPELPRDWLHGINTIPEFPRFESPPEGGMTAWYTMALARLGNVDEYNNEPDLQTAIDDYVERSRKQANLWVAKFQDVK